MTFGTEPLIERAGETITGEALTLDGHFFRGCRIERCQVMYAGGNWGFADTVFVDCGYVFGGRALFILDSTARMMGFDVWEKLFTQLRADAPPRSN